MLFSRSDEIKKSGKIVFYSGLSKMRLKRRGRNIEHRHSSLARGWPNRESEMAADAPIYTLGALLLSSAAINADSPELLFPDRRVRYRKLNASARAWARPGAEERCVGKMCVSICSP